MGHLDLILLTQHLRGKMRKQGFSIYDVLKTLEANDVIETYPMDTPYPSRLLYGKVDGRVMHVVSALHQGVEHVVTIYPPDLDHFESDFRTRKGGR